MYATARQPQLKPQPNPQPAGGPQGAAGATYGACPNCNRTLPVTAIGCPHCRAIFDDTAAWRVLPDASRMPEMGSFLPVLPAGAAATSRWAAQQRVRGVASLAVQILRCRDTVTLEDQRNSFNPAMTFLQAVCSWGFIGFHLLMLASVTSATFHTVFTALLWLTPIAIVVLYLLESEEASKEPALHKVQLDLSVGELTIECRQMRETQSRWRRVPLADLRLDAQLDEESHLDGEGFRIRRGPSINLRVPGDLPLWPALSYALIDGDDHDPQAAATTYAALLAHTGIAAVTTPA